MEKPVDEGAVIRAAIYMLRFLMETRMSSSDQALVAAAVLVNLENEMQAKVPEYVFETLRHGDLLARCKPVMQ